MNLLDFRKSSDVPSCLFISTAKPAKSLFGPKDWYAVATDDDGIIAYFFKESDAYRFCLDYINRQLNP